MCRGSTLQSAECHPCTLVAECHHGTSDAPRNFMPVVRKVSRQEFLPILGAPQLKITNRVFLTVVRPNGAFDRRATKACFWSFWGATMSQIFEILTCRDSTFMPMVPKGALQDFLPLFGAPWPEITNRSFWPSCDQMVLFTSVRPKCMFGLFDHHATKWCFWPVCDQNVCSFVLTVVRLGYASVIRD